MDKHKKLTLEEIIARKNQSNKDKLQLKEFYLPNLDGNIVFESKPLSKVLELMDCMGDKESAKENYEFYKELIYMHCAIMHNKELQEAYECSEPVDIVDKLFDNSMGLIVAAGEEIFGFYDLDKEIESIKNL